MNCFTGVPTKNTQQVAHCFLEPKQHGMVILWYVQFMIQVKNTPRRPVVLTESGRRPRRWCNEPERGKIRHHCTCTTVCCLSRMQKSKWVRTDAYVFGIRRQQGSWQRKSKSAWFPPRLGSITTPNIAWHVDFTGRPTLRHLYKTYRKSSDRMHFKNNDLSWEVWGFRNVIRWSHKCGCNGSFSLSLLWPSIHPHGRTFR